MSQRKREVGLRSPSKHDSIAHLQAVVDADGLIDSGNHIEYAVEEVKDELWAKRQRRADKDLPDLIDFALAPGGETKPAFVAYQVTGSPVIAGFRREINPAPKPAPPLAPLLDRVNRAYRQFIKMPDLGAFRIN